MNAVERFLGRGLNDIQQVAKETLEGNLRGVLATLTPEEVNEDRLKFADSLAAEVEQDLAKLGLHLDVLKIQHVTDDANYLASIGRERIAQVIRDAEIAESNALNEAAKESAAAEMRAKVAEADADKAIVQKKNELRHVTAELEGEAKSLEMRAEQAGLAAQATAEQALQGVRRDLEAVRLQAEVVVPAEVQREAAALDAAGAAAKIAEDGRASAESLALVADAWKAAGPSAPDMFLINRLEEITKIVVESVGQIQLGPVHLIDSGDGQALPKFAASYPLAVATVLRSLAETTGVDVTALLGQSGAAAAAQVAQGADRRSVVTGLVVALVVVVALFGLAISFVLTRFLYICQPNAGARLLGSAPRAVTGAEGRKVGYRIIKGGRAVRIPLIEIVDSMDLTNMPIEVGVQGAYSKGGIPLNVQGIANVKIAGEQPVLDNAIERFLGCRSRADHADREGDARGQPARRARDADARRGQPGQDQVSRSRCIVEADHDLRRLGLELDTLKIQHVSDDMGYLDSIGRKQSAEV